MSTIDELNRLHEAAAGTWKKCSANDGKCMCGLVWSTEADRVVCSCSADERANADEWDHKNADAIVALHNAWPAIHRVLVAARKWYDAPFNRGDGEAALLDMAEALRALDGHQG